MQMNNIATVVRMGKLLFHFYEKKMTTTNIRRLFQNWNIDDTLISSSLHWA